MRLPILFHVVFWTYLAINAYVLAAWRRASPWAQRNLAFLAAGVFVLVLAPLVGRWILHRGGVALGRAVAQLGYVWLAFVFWSFMLHFAFDMWNLLVRIASLVRSDYARFHLPAPVAAKIVMGISAAGLLTGALQARHIRVTAFHVPTPSLPPGRQVRLAQLSDLHLTGTRGIALLEQVRRILKPLNVDVLVSTGDLVDAPFEDHRFISELQALRPPLGFFGVLGNHEYFAGLGRALPFYRDAGIRLLRSEAVELIPGLWLAGVDDPAGIYTGQDYRADEAALAQQCPEDAFRVLLKHQPVVHAAPEPWADLQLSGHTHAGQIFPFEWWLKLLYRYTRGLYRVGPSHWLYVSRGTGTWGPPLRLFATPEIVLFVLEGVDPSSTNPPEPRSISYTSCRSRTGKDHFDPLCLRRDGTAPLPP